ncbi:MAG: class I SAM-dependent methyltransferase, partial [Lachnospiraceae bacterium]|nr:class I SAM-dependent methyltransferase [Lachnospiraceae bacterium]
MDLTHYPGEDLYSEGEIEDRLLKVAEENDPADFRKIVETSGEWAYLYHLSKERQNIVSWLPVKKDEKVLEVGAGMGAITGELCKLAKSVDAVDLSLKRSKINANRNKCYDNLSINVGNFTEIEKDLGCDYDWIMLIGVFEYAISYMGTDDPFRDFLKILKKHLKENGRIVIAIENRLGLKYFAGCKEDHTCGFFDGLENYVNGGQVRTFSKQALEKIIKSVDITDYHFYYPYPDYKLPNTVFSDKRLPSYGELRDNIRNFDQDRLVLFDEKNAYDSLIEDGLFPVFSNSFEVIIGPDVDVDYAKYSMERDDKLCVMTKIISDGTKKSVVKSAVYESAKEHIAKIKKACDELNVRYTVSDLKINNILNYDEAKGEIEFEFVEGKTLEEIFDECVRKNDKEEFLKYFNKYKEYAYHNDDYPVVNDDFIFSNIIINDDGWNVIDYEWVRFTKG